MGRMRRTIVMMRNIFQNPWVEAVVEAEGQLITSNPRMRVKEHRMIQGLKKICSFQPHEEREELEPEAGVEVGVEAEELLVVRLLPHLRRKEKVVMTRKMI